MLLFLNKNILKVKNIYGDLFMDDFLHCGRLKLLFEDTDLYGRVFSESRSKTAEHNIYERSKLYLDSENEKFQKEAKTGENQS